MHLFRALVFAAAVGVGDAVGPVGTAGASTSTPVHSATDDDHAEPAAADLAPGGLAVAADGYALELATSTQAPGTSGTLRFTVTGPDGEPLTDVVTGRRLVLGNGEKGDEWAFERIGTEREKMAVEKELQDLRERLRQVEEWTARRDAIEKELSEVWVAGGTEPLPPPAYTAEGDGKEGEEGDEVEVQREEQREREVEAV